MKYAKNENKIKKKIQSYLQSPNIFQMKKPKTELNKMVLIK